MQRQMEELHEENRIKAEILRRAQLAMLNGEIQLKEGENINLLRSGETEIQLFGVPHLNTDSIPDFTHPYFWAGFTMVGSPW